MKTIFDKLLTNKINHAVCVGIINLKTRIWKDELISRDYFIIIVRDNKKDKILRELGFHIQDGPYINKILSYTLSDSEIDIFKTLSNNYNKVIHNSDGRVYELKNESFLKEYRKYENTNQINFRGSRDKNG